MLEDRYGRKLYPVHRLDRETSGVILLARADCF
ncbi:MAG: pseudouridine synthase [Syntrophales bacterium]